MSDILWAALMGRDNDTPKGKCPAGEAITQRKCLFLPKWAEYREGPGIRHVRMDLTMVTQVPQP